MNLPGSEERKNHHTQKRKWYRVLILLSFIVVFGINYMLQLSAITMQRECQIEEHTHTDVCYQSADEENTEQLQICGQEEHTHGSDCMPDITVQAETEPLPAAVILETERLPEMQAEIIIEPEPDFDVVIEIETESDQELILETESELESVFETESESEAIVQTEKETETVSNEPAAILLDESETAETAVNDPLQVTDYVTAAQLQYRAQGSSEWKIADSGSTETIPANADLKLTVQYANVPIETLIAAGLKMEYTLPGQLRNVTVDGTMLDENNQKIGTLSISDDKTNLELTFSEEWLEQAQKAGSTTIETGSFYIEAKVDLKQISTEGELKLVIGNVEITMNFGDDILAQYGDVQIEKTLGKVQKEDDGDYLYYTLKVTAGEDGCPNVLVKDQFNEKDKQYIEGYTFLSEETIYSGETKKIESSSITSSEESASFTWRIGNMAAGEVRILTYKVKLTDTYLAGKTPQDPSFQNTATVYTTNTESNTKYERDSATAEFTAKGEATLTKVASDYMPDQAGGGKIRYTIWIKADDANTYTLNNVRIKDTLDGTQIGSWTNATDSSIRKQIYYEADSFELFEGGVRWQNGSTNLTKVDPQPSGQPVLMDTDNDGLMNDSFTYAVGPLAPGECRTLVYEVHIKPEVFAAAGNNSVKIQNRAAVITEDEKEVYNTFSVTKDIGRKTWLRKIADTAPTENKQTIAVSGSIYQYNENDQIVQGNSAQTSFTVPAGSFKYQVVINEAGGWNLTNAQMTDTIKPQDRIAYTGYVRIDAYTISSSADGQLTVKTDAEALQELQGMSPAHTVWLDVNGRNSFSFAPNDLGLNGTYAYLLTYYASPKDLTGVTTAQIYNTFELTGSAVWGIGAGNTSYEFPKISANASIQVEGSNHFSAEKKAWYYEADAENSSTGAIYWVMKVSGKTIPAGTTFSDNWKKAGVMQNFHSVVGVYRSKLDDITKTFKDAEKLNAAATDQLTVLTENVDYTVDQNDQSYNFILKNNLELADTEYLYFVVSTKPDQLPEGNRGSNTYTNAFFAKDPNSNEWYELDRDSYTVYSKTGIFKELGQIFQYDGTTAKEIRRGDNGSSSLPLNEWRNNPAKFIPGYYVAWQIQVNHDASLEGRYRIVEQIPEGMEAVCVRTYWEGSEIKKNGTAPTFQQIEGLDSSWTKHDESYSGKASIYYTNDQQLIWEAGDFHRETDRTKSHKDLWSVEYQIICRVTDPDVLLGGAAKDFCNQVSLYQNDNLISQDSHSVTIQCSNLTKDGKQYENPKSEYEFTIKVNPLGTDLLKGSDSLTIVDQMSDNLIFLPETLVVKNSNNEVVLESQRWKSSYDSSKHILTLIVPDSLPLTITYRAKIDARPGEKVTISNQAHWEGYESSEGATFTKADVSYEAGGTAVAAATPEVRVLKYDQNDTSKTLQGAEFSLTPGAVSLEGETAGQFAASAGSKVIKGITDENGQITFSTGSDYTLAFNQIYCLTETKAPEGYVLDSTPHYFVVTKEPTANTSEKEKTKYKDLQQCLSSLKELQSENKITVKEQQATTGTIYTHYAYNHKGEISVEKHFLNVTGEDLGSKLSGTYRFGLYKKPAPEESEEPEQTIELVFQADSTAQTAKFSNLDLDTPYYVYELDDQGKPIMAGAEATVSRIPFIVTYTKKQGKAEVPSITLTAQEWSGQADVYNQINYPELPQTGGTGTIHYPQIGLLLLLLSGLLGLYFKSRSVQRTK